MSLLVYEFIETDVANALIVVRPLNKSLVFVSLAGSKMKLINEANRFVSQANSSLKKKGVQFILKDRTILEPEGSEWLEQLTSDFTQLLTCGTIQNEIKCEYLTGTEFQKKVWEITKTLKPGVKVSYHQLATLVGNPKAARAVGSALGKNNIAVVIPCHRIVGSDGKLTGFRWGVELKKTLLRLEEAIV